MRATSTPCSSTMVRPLKVSVPGPDHRPGGCSERSVCTPSEVSSRRVGSFCDTARTDPRPASRLTKVLRAGSQWPVKCWVPMVTSPSGLPSGVRTAIRPGKVAPTCQEPSACGVSTSLITPAWSELPSSPLMVSDGRSTSKWSLAGVTRGRPAQCQPALAPADGSHCLRPMSRVSVRAVAASEVTAGASARAPPGAASPTTNIAAAPPRTHERSIIPPLALVPPGLHVPCGQT